MGARRVRIPLWLRGLRSRPLVNLLLLSLAAVAVATAVLGPLLIRSVQQFTLQTIIAAAPVDQTSVRVTQVVGTDVLNLLGEYEASTATVGGVMRRVAPPSGSTAWQPPFVDLVSTSNVTWATGPRGEASSRVVVARDCTTYALTAGRCPADLGEVVVSRPDAERAGLAIDRPLTLTQLAAGPKRLRVVGVYDPAAADHGQLVRPGTPSGELGRITAEPLLVVPEQAVDLSLPAAATAQLSVSAAVTADDIAGLRTTVAAVETVAGTVPDVALGVESKLPALLDRIERQGRAAALLMAVTVVQAVLLALFATATVLQRVARARAPEWGIGRLRGVPRGRWLASVYAEPGLVLLAGLPLGYALGAAVARAAVSRHLDPATPVELFRWPVLGVAALAALGALLALVGVSVRSVRRPLPELIASGTEPRGLTAPAAVAQTAVVLLAAASLYQLLAGGVLAGERSLLGLLAPALFALALAVLAVRIAVLVVRRVTTRPPRSLGALVVGRQTARTPSSLNPAVVVAAGTALAVFAGQVVVFANRNADLRAAAVVGADQVLAVSVPPGIDLTTAVRDADPSGEWAMAAQEQEGAGTARIVAVDSTRLTQVAAWLPRWAGVADVTAALRPPTERPLLLRGRTLTISLAKVKVTSLAEYVDDMTGYGKPSVPQLQVTVDTGREWRTLDLGPLRPGTGQFQADLPCADTCRLVSVGLLQAFPAPYEATFIVTGLATDEQPATELARWLDTAALWRPVIGERVTFDVSNSVIVLAEPDGLALTVTDSAGRQATRMAPADTVEPLPVLVGPRVLLAPLPGQPDVVNGTGLNGRTQQVRLAGRAVVLPRALDDGVLTDLGNARGLADPSAVTAVAQVWLRAGAPPEIEQRLTEAGLQVQSRETLADRAAELRREAVPRAAVLSVWVAGLALLLSVLALVAARVADADRRRRDWRALRQAGVAPRTLRRLVFAEVALPALLGGVVGLAAGLGAIRVAAERLPLTDLEAPGPPLDVRLEWLPAAGVAGAVLVVIVLVAAVAAVTEARRGRLR